MKNNIFSLLKNFQAVHWILLIVPNCICCSFSPLSNPSQRSCNGKTVWLRLAVCVVYTGVNFMLVFVKAECIEDWRCGTREGSPGNNGLWVSSSGCSRFSISKIQVDLLLLWKLVRFPGKRNTGTSHGIRVCVAGQVDWAALAQAWIAQKESSGTTLEQQPQQQQPNGQDGAGLDTHNNHTNFQNDSNFNRMWQPGRWTL